MPHPDPSRRQFLAFLAASPLAAAAGIDHDWLAALGGRTPRREDPLLEVAHRLAAAQDTLPPGAIRSAAEALNVFDFEPVAKARVPVAHWGYLMTGSDDDRTIAANRAGFDRWALRPRRLVDVSTIDMGVTHFGTRYPTPIILNPVGSQKAFHPEGELATARAARARNHLFVLSTVGTTAIEDVIAARGGPAWFQLYHQDDWALTRQMVQRMERAGVPALVFTVDLLGSNRETQQREARRDTRTCTRCHLGGEPKPGMTQVSQRDNRRKPNLNGYQALPPILEKGTPTWEFVDRLRQSTSMKVLLKGIVTREDAELAVEHGVDGLFVSNHGGRAENSLRATVTSLPEVLEGTAGRIPVICDGGFRRGTDAFKAMALGATAIGVGRPYIWGLGAFGQEGVEAVLRLLRKELEIVMKQCGTPSLAAITRRHITEA